MTPPRTKILFSLLGLVLLYYGGDWLWRHAVEGPLESRRLKKERLQKDLDKRTDELAQARDDAKQLALWQEQSLPSDPQVARSLYQAWLLRLVGKAGLANPNVDSGDPVSRKGLYQSIAFSVQGRGTIEQLTQFLYGFYRAGHLHQIRSLSITPVGKTDQLDLAISVEALILPGKSDSEGLNPTPSDRLAWDRIEDYAVIARRNLFGSAGTSDPTEQAYVTTIQYVNGQPQVWLTLRTEDRVLKLQPGDSFQVGAFTGKVLEIEGDDVVLEADGLRWLVSLGENLAQAWALPPEY